MDLSRSGYFIYIAVIVFLLTGCACFKGSAPQGFAPYKGRKYFRTVSPDGVVYRIRTMKNKPYAELSFWREAMQVRMKQAGYAVIDTSQISLGETRGALLELAAPLGNEDYSYLIAIFPKKKRLLIVETSGEVGKFQARKPQIIEAIKKIEF